MTRFTAKQHTVRAVIGLVCGFIVALVSAVGHFLEFGHGKGHQWAWATLLAVPLVIWGCTHLARRRGYSSGTAYGLVVVGLFISLVTITSRSPLVLGFILLCMEALPVGILLALPQIRGNFRR